jgi:ParB family chromosome partitioning protein
MILPPNISDSPSPSESKKNRLGRGLAALIGDVVVEKTELVRSAELGETKNVLPIEAIRANSANPRRRFSEEDIAELARSIKENGLLQPIIVRPVEGEAQSYEIVAGERRWRAAQLAQLHEVPVVVRSLSDAQALEIAIIENGQRADLNPVEEASGYRRLMDEFQYTQDDLSKIIGKSRSHVANTLRLINLPDIVKRHLIDGLLSAGHARALISAPNIEYLAGEIVRHGLSVRQTEALVKGGHESMKSVGSGRKNSSTVEKIDPNIKALEKDLAESLGLTVSLVHRSVGDGPGELKINYRTLDQLDEVCRRLMAVRTLK